MPADGANALFAGIFLFPKTFMTIDNNFAVVFDALENEQKTLLIGQVIQILPNSDGGQGFLVAKTGDHRRYRFLGIDCPDKCLPEVGALVSFDPLPRNGGRYPRARNLEILAMPEQAEIRKR